MDDIVDHRISRMLLKFMNDGFFVSWPGPITSTSLALDVQFWCFVELSLALPIIISGDIINNAILLSALNCGDSRRNCTHPPAMLVHFSI